MVHEPPTLDGVPDELQPLIASCLAKEPEDRPTARELVAVLAGAQQLPERSVAARPGFAERTPTQSAAGARAGGATSAAGAAATGGTSPRRLPRLRRSLLVPMASAVAVVAAISTVLAVTLGSSSTTKTTVVVTPPGPKSISGTYTFTRTVTTCTTGKFPAGFCCVPAAVSPAFRSWFAASAIAWTVLIPYCSLGLSSVRIAIL